MRKMPSTEAWSAVAYSGARRSGFQSTPIAIVVGADFGLVAAWNLEYENPARWNQSILIRLVSRFTQHEPPNY